MTYIPPTVLLILDGYGQAPASKGNAVSLANTPTLDALLELPTRTQLLCSGEAVGLPAGYMGNSEVGHMNIGAGRVVYQDMPRIDMSISDNSFFSNSTLLATFQAVKKNNKSLHLVGLLSDGGVHSHINHLFALLSLAEKLNTTTYLHIFMDGRDTAPTKGLEYLQQLEQMLPPCCCIATVSGRYYSMDRDKRWDRTALAWDAVVHSKGEHFLSPIEYMKESYNKEVLDEFIIPAVSSDYSGIVDGDAVFMFNFRADRMRQLAHAFYDSDPFEGFNRGKRPKLSALASMTTYESSIDIPLAFPHYSISKGLGEIVENAGLSQLRIAETEKYAHVTFFFNGGKEKPFANESRQLIPSPRDVATYDLKPEMSAAQITDTLIEELHSKKPHFVVCNLANMDMVGHTGKIPATIKACEAVDVCVSRILQAINELKGLLVITADHGNAEQMLFPDGSPCTTHSKNPVAFILTGPFMIDKKIVLRNGKLGDIAPTLLQLWGLPIPVEMTGNSLIAG